MCAIAAAAVFLLSAARPGRAPITGATISTTQPSFTGACPATITFTGAITGTAGTTFTYNFVRIDHGVFEFSGDTAATMPASGSLAVTDSVTISASTNNSEQLVVKNIAGGQPNVYSTALSYSVTCKFNPGARPPNSQLNVALTLHPKWTGVREYEYKWVGATLYVPERGTGPCPDLCVGWFHLHNGDSFWLYHWNTFDRAFFGYDPVAFNGLTLSRATLKLTVSSGDTACFGRVGRAVLTQTPIMRETTQTFQAPYPADADFSLATAPQLTPTSATIDVTNIVRAWVSGKMPNQGFVIRGKVEDNGSNGNDSCSLRFAKDAVLTIMP